MKGKKEQNKNTKEKNRIIHVSDMKEIQEIIDTLEFPEEIEVPGLFRPSIIIDEYSGYKNVIMSVIRWDNEGIPFDPIDHVPDSIYFKDEISKKHSINHIAEYFTHDEIIQIKKYLKRYKGTKSFDCCPCTIPKDGNVFPLGGLPGSSGETDYYLFYERKDYNLPFNIAGFFYLRCHERI